FQRPGRTGERDAVADELIALSARHDLPTFQILGHLIKIQVHAARAEFEPAQGHADAAERLAAVHETPLVHVFTAAFRAMRLAERSPTRPRRPAPTGRWPPTWPGRACRASRRAWSRSRSSRCTCAAGNPCRPRPTSTRAPTARGSNPCSA